MTETNEWRAKVPFSSDTFKCPPHERILVEYRVEMIDRQRKQVAVRFGSDAGDASGVGEQADFTEVGSVAQTGGHLAVAHDDVDDAFLDEVHLGADRAFLDDDVGCKGQSKQETPNEKVRQDRIASVADSQSYRVGRPRR